MERAGGGRGGGVVGGDMRRRSLRSIVGECERCLVMLRARARQDKMRTRKELQTGLEEMRTDSIKFPAVLRA